MNLIVGDIFKCVGQVFTKSITDAELVIKWFNNHSVPLSIFQQEQMQHLGVILCLILPVITRWTTHYQAISRMVTLQRVFYSVITFKREALMACFENRDRHTLMDTLERLEHPKFWPNLIQYASSLMSVILDPF